MGSFEVPTLVGMELIVRYHSEIFLALTYSPDRGGGQYLVGSLTGAVASQNVTEAFTKVG